MKTVLLVIAHTDDETIGAGGTIAKHVEAGDKVFAVSLTNGVGSRFDSDGFDVSSRLEASANAANILGFTWLDNFDFPDNKLDSVPLLDVIKELEKIKERVRPNLVYTHSPADLNIDHRVTCEAVLVVFRPEPYQQLRELRLIEVQSATNFSHPGLTSEFRPLVFENIENFWDKKLLALSAYGDEIRPFPHSRSIRGLEALATLRGSQVGLPMAEAFDLVRIVEK